MAPPALVDVLSPATPADVRVRPEELARGEMLRILPDAALEHLAARARRREWRPGQVVFREGDPADALHVVCGGAFSVVRPSRDPGLVVQRLHTGAVFGEDGALSGAPRLVSIIAVADAATLEIAKPDLDEVLAGDPLAMRQILGALATQLALAREEIARQSSRLELKVRERTQELRESQLELVRRLATAAESRDDATGEHTTRMSRMCALLGRDAGLSDAEAEQLMHASSMHDIGKIAIPDSVLLKRGRLTVDEWEVMKSHTTVGAELLSGSRSPVVRMAEVIARTHHEKWDGTGYPAGLEGESIPLPARICAVCDVFDALISERPYKAPWAVDEALDELRRLAGTHLDPTLVELFLRGRPDLRATA